MTLFEKILKARGLEGEAKQKFLHPDFTSKHDPYLLPDMQAAVNRLEVAYQKQEKITIYGDYDIDGLTATTLLLDAFDSFGYLHVEAFIPNRFVEGYGLTVNAVEKIASAGANLIITVDCGSLSTREIERANQLGVDVIVTDHHNVQAVQPPAVAVINPKRQLMDYPDLYDSEYRILANRKTISHQYPFLDLPGVGVAFKLVQALQGRLDGLSEGQEKWLLDLVALGTVCDVVKLVDENRMHVYWGLKVLAKTRRPGLKALMAVAGVEPSKVNARSLGFALGPRMNAAGRLETAQIALDLLRSKDPIEALALARQLDGMNTKRRADQDVIFQQAVIQAEKYIADDVLVVSSSGWNHGIIGIVAAKLLEKYKKPTFVFEEMAAQHESITEPQVEGQDVSVSKQSSEPLISKGSARSYGDFSAADAIRASDDLITKGGGHKLAAGVTLMTDNIDAFRQRVNQYYRSLGLIDQARLLLPAADAEASFDEITTDLIDALDSLEPFGNSNPQPIIQSLGITVLHVRRMGAEGQHIRLQLADRIGASISMVAFNAPEYFFVEPETIVKVWYQPNLNEWQGRRSVEGRLLHLEIISEES